jgi:general stress protein 26
MTQNLHSSELSLERVIELARSIGTGMLVTDSEDGFRSRPMSVAEVTDEGELWFLTSLSSPKVEELTRNPHVVVVLASSGKFLSVTGTATLERDPLKIRSLWSEAYRVWFKDERDPDLILLRVEPSWAEYWDQSGWNGLKYAARAAKAYIKGEQLREVDDVHTHAKVRL